MSTRTDATPSPANGRLLDRRRALRLLAASGGVVAGTSLIVSSPAIASTGSSACRYDFSGTPQLSTRIRNRRNNGRDRLQMTVAGVGGTCPCGGTATIEYAYHVALPGLGQDTFGWTPNASAEVSSPRVLWGNGGGSATVGAAVRATCTGASGQPETHCLYATATYNVGAANFDQTFGLPIASSSQPGSLPPCGPTSAAAAFRTISSIVIAPGIGPDEPDEPIEPEPIDLAPEPAPRPQFEIAQSEPSPTTTTPPASTTTSTTTAPSASTTTSTTTTTPPSTTSTTAATTTTPTTTSTTASTAASTVSVTSTTPGG